MKKIVAFALMLILSICCVFNLSANAALSSLNQTKEILFLSSYDPTWDTVPQQLEGIKTTLYDNFNITTEYMDTKNIKYTELRKQEYYLEFSKKYKDLKPFDLVIVGDDDAMDFVYSFQHELFDQIPIVFEGVNDITNASKYVENEKIVGLVERTEYLKLIKFCQKMLPDAKKINVVYDDTLSGKGEISSFRAAQANFPEFEVNEVNTSLLSASEIKNAIKSFSKEDISIYLICSENKDKSYNKEERIELLRQSVCTPIFRSNVLGIGDVFVGGYLYSHFEAGKIVGNVANSILLNEISTNEVKLITTSTSEYVLDYNLTKHYQLDTSTLDVKFEWNNYNPSFFEAYHSEIIIAVSITTLALVIIAVILALLFMALKAKNKIEKMTAMDVKTNAYSYSKLLEDINTLLKEKESFYLVGADIRNFKQINDVYGHQFGDQVLSESVDMVLNIIKGNTKLYRFEGDEFCAIVRKSNKENILQIVKEIQKDIKENKLIKDSNIFFKVDCVAIECPTEVDNRKDLFIETERLLEYHKKNQIRSVILFYSDINKENLNEDNNLIYIINEHIINKKILMLYQPVYSLKKKKIIGFEALMRLPDSPYGPAKFIPVAEKSGQINELGKISLNKAINFLKRMSANGFEDITVSVNYSARQLNDKTFIPYLKKLIDESGVNPSNINIEIIETSIIENANDFLQFYNELKELGVHIVLDDFGTGYSSISMLLSYHFKTIKFDKSISDHLFDDENRTSQLIDFCHSFDSTIVAEGIEKQKQKDILESFGCDAIQGYLIAKPLTEDDAIKILMDKNV